MQKRFISFNEKLYRHGYSVGTQKTRGKINFVIKFNFIIEWKIPHSSDKIAAHFTQIILVWIFSR